METLAHVKKTLATLGISPDDTYYKSHLRRFALTLDELRQIPVEKERALEVGYTPLFQHFLAKDIGFQEVWGTEFKLLAETVEISEQSIGEAIRSKIIRVNIEHDRLPVSDGLFDFIMCSEVIEHMDVDPMFALSEFNRVLKLGGYIFISTPNSTSYAMIAKVLNGFRPHFYMQYQKDRSPYRHNYEHDRYSLSSLTTAAGFNTIDLKSVDAFEPPHPAGIEYCARLGLSNEFRGDCLFYLGQKISGVLDRFPAEIYV